jgi:hypothetical protein
MRNLMKYAILGWCTSGTNVLYAQNVSTVDGMTITKLPSGVTITKVQGLYRYKSGGIPLFGYLSVSKTRYLPDDQVSFAVCNTGHVITVRYGDLAQVEQNCPSVPVMTYPEAAASVWQEWKLSSGKFEAIQKPGIGNGSRSHRLDLKDLSISDLPKDYQDILPAQQRDKPAAVTLWAPNTGPLLGIVENKGM